MGKSKMVASYFCILPFDWPKFLYSGKVQGHSLSLEIQGVVFTLVRRKHGLEIHGVRDSTENLKREDF